MDPQKLKTNPKQFKTSFKKRRKQRYLNLAVLTTISGTAILKFRNFAGSKKPTEIVVISAHMDSWDIGQVSFTIREREKRQREIYRARERERE